MTTKQCIDDLLMRGCDDWLYVAEVVSVVKCVAGGSPIELQRLTIDLIQLVAQQGLMEVGDLSNDGFHKWDLPIEACLSRVQREWNALGRNPSLGEICWLQITDKGRELGEQLLKQRKSPP